MASNDFSPTALDQVVLRWRALSARRTFASAGRCGCGCNCKAAENDAQRLVRALTNTDITTIAESAAPVPVT